MQLRAVSETDFLDEVLKSPSPVVVDFYAEWCGPCRQVSAALQLLAHEWDGKITFVKADVDENPMPARAYRILSIPAVLLFENGEVSAWSIGAKPGYVIEKELGLRKVAKRLAADDPVGPNRDIHWLIPSGCREDGLNDITGVLLTARAWWKGQAARLRA
ncbi:MAG: thioredoxin family protein, partial [Actinomycetota bacterium]